MRSQSPLTPERPGHSRCIHVVCAQPIAVHGKRATHCQVLRQLCRCPSEWPHDFAAFCKLIKIMHVQAAQRQAGLLHRQ